MAYSLEFIVRSGDQVRRYPVAMLPIYVGRDPDSVERTPDSEVIVIRDAAVSRWQFTLHPQSDHIEVEMNPHSPNQLRHGGKVSLRGRFYPGEFFDIGPHRFEVDAQAELPLPAPSALPADPAGNVDIALAVEYERIVPRWREREREGTRAEQKAMPSVSGQAPVWRRTLLVIGFATLGLVAYLQLPSAPVDDTKQQKQNFPDVFPEIKPIDCLEDEACLKIAQDQYQNARTLLEHDPEDLVSRYKIARSLYRAKLALHGNQTLLPEVEPHFQQARQSFETSFADVHFRYQRAKEHEDAVQQLSAIQELRSICKEEPHSFCQGVELTYQKLRE